MLGAPAASDSVSFWTWSSASFTSCDPISGSKFRNHKPAKECFDTDTRGTGGFFDVPLRQ
jgi:hypothetical protein